MIVLGIDGGLAALGWTLARLGPVDLGVVGMGVVRTEQSAKKLRALAADDTARRVAEIGAAMSPLFAQADLVCIESFSPPRNASAAAKAAMAYAVALEQARARGLPLLHFSPQQIKVAAAGKKNASKEEVAEALAAAYPEAEALLAGTTPSIRDHAWDALGAIRASLSSDLVRALRRKAAA